MAPIRAEIIGKTMAKAEGLTVTGPDLIDRLCRSLVSAGHDPSRSMHVYRGERLTTRVPKIGEAAEKDARRAFRA